jgi:hypothetical protein
MYRGSCRVDTGVILHVNSQEIYFLGTDGFISKIPRFEVIGLARYPLPYLPVTNIHPRDRESIAFYKFETFRNGSIATLAIGWPIAFNSENIQVLTQDGTDHLINRNDLWGVSRVAAPSQLHFATNGQGSLKKYELRHPLAFESCPPNITPGEGEPKRVIPQTQLNEPISIKREHDFLRAGYEKLEDYEDRQRFYAVPQYYSNITRLGTWALFNSRYSNVGARQVNFLPLVEDEFSDGPFGFQRVLRSGVAPILWALQEEPMVQIFYGLKADYIHLDVFADPTAPLIGERYRWKSDQLDPIDDRLIEKGGMEFGLDFSYFSLFFAFSSGEMGIRAEDDFAESTFGITRAGFSAQYNYYKLAFYIGEESVELAEDLDHSFQFLKALYQSQVNTKFAFNAQYIQRKLVDRNNPKAPFIYDGESQTIASEIKYNLTYRWRLNALVSMENLSSSFEAKDGTSDSRSKIHPKLSSGITIAF